MNPGAVIVIGSGETAASGRKIFHELFSELPPPIRVAILETPAGFELNSAWVAGQVAEFLEHRLRNFRPAVSVVPARKRGTPFSPDDPAIIAPMYGANVLYMGAGSPTYTVRQLAESLAWQTLVAKHRLGSSLVFASACSLAISAYTIPVYEIYKVGLDVHWTAGLDLFGPYGLSLAFVPHWNNQDGGENLDTSRCFMGRSRFAELLRLLPAGVTVIGVEEHTGLLIDPDEGCCRVLGRGDVVLLRDGDEIVYRSGQSFSVLELGPFKVPDCIEGVPAHIVERVQAAEEAARQMPAPKPTDEVRRLVQARETARAGRDWSQADVAREQIERLGWQVRDTETGPVLVPLEE